MIRAMSLSILTRQRSRGFTLVEIAVAVAILGLALGILLSLQGSYLSMAIRDKHLTQAALLGKRLMTLIEVNKSAPESGTIERDLVDALKDEELETSEEQRLEQLYQGWKYRRIVTSIDLPELADAFRRIDLTLSWGDSPDEEYTIVYFMRTPEE